METKTHQRSPKFLPAQDVLIIGNADDNRSCFSGSGKSSPQRGPQTRAHRVVSADKNDRQADWPNDELNPSRWWGDFDDK
jgi:hypothetical protein